MADNNKSQASRAKKKWSERDTTRFVELYEAEEVLWNVRLKEYKNKDARNAALQRLIRSFDFEIHVDDVNKKINNIRSTYMQERAKIKNSMRTGSGAEDIYVPTLAWYEIADRFLADIVKCRKSFKNIESERDEISSPEIPASPSPDIPSSHAVEEQVSSDTFSSSATAEAVTTSRVSPSRASPSQSLFVKPQNFKAKKRANVDRIEKSIEQLQTIKDQVLLKKSDEPEDEFSYFGKNIASQLRQLPMMDALDLESEIFELVKRKRKSFMEQESFPANTDNSSYTIEIPDHVLHGVWSQNNASYEVMEESQSILIPHEQAPELQDNALDQAVRSIGGLNNPAEE